ncbi:MAG: HEPN domain-containing protein [Thermodesulfobacteriota bacterium]|nr:HEPN domain-containing protein [Thermodesulfobacteriota bacterium]
MSEYSFRTRFYRSPTDTLNIDSSKWELPLAEEGRFLVLCSNKKEDTIQNSTTIVFKSDGWPSENDALKAANKYVNALMLTLARLRIGADFGNRGPKSAFANAGLDMIGAKTGCRVLNDEHGLMFYESEPLPKFATMSADFLRGVNQNHFEQIFTHAINFSRDITERERLSMKLFNASFFQKSADSRFLVLVMAIEALLEPAPRSPSARAHVEKMISATKETNSLSPEEKNSFIGALKWLFNESINQAGRRLARSHLGERTYANKSAESFFSYCYTLRSKLVHGANPLPSQQDIGSAVAQLEVFVSDILSGELRGIELT